jgi:hypothetical protein
MCARSPSALSAARARGPALTLLAAALLLGPGCKREEAAGRAGPAAQQLDDEPSAAGGAATGAAANGGAAGAAAAPGTATTTTGAPLTKPVRFSLVPDAREVRVAASPLGAYQGYEHVSLHSERPRAEVLEHYAAQLRAAGYEVTVDAQRGRIKGRTPDGKDALVVAEPEPSGAGLSVRVSVMDPPKGKDPLLEPQGYGGHRR